MPRTTRVASGGMVFHILNRGVARMPLFEKAADYQVFEGVLRETRDQSPMRICAYSFMPNHWHRPLWPEHERELARFMQRLTITHIRRWPEHRRYAGLGHINQGRYQSFPVESDEHFWVVARYVERNALRVQFICVPRNGDGRVCGVTFMARRRSVPCWQRGRSSGRRNGSSGSFGPTTKRAGVAPPKRAPRAPLWSAGVAKADRETIGPRVGLSSQWSTVEDGPFRIRSVDRLESPPRDLPHKICPAPCPFGCCVASAFGRGCWEPRSNPIYRYRTCPVPLFGL
jgi:REP element-mobilizing transposase RayT